MATTTTKRLFLYNDQSNQANETANDQDSIIFLRSIRIKSIVIVDGVSKEINSKGDEFNS